MNIVYCERHRLFSRYTSSYFHSEFDLGWVHRHEDRYSAVFFLSLLGTNQNPSVTFPVASCVKSNEGHSPLKIREKQS